MALVSTGKTGANSATYHVNSTSTALSDTQWDLLPKGQLYDLLNAVYASGINSFIEAFSDAGGMVGVVGEDAAAAAVWSLDGSNKPVLTVTSTAGTDNTVARISLSYSASA